MRGKILIILVAIVIICMAMPANAASYQKTAAQKKETIKVINMNGHLIAKSLVPAFVHTTVKNGKGCSCGILDSTMSNLVCLMSAEFDGPCDVFKMGIFYHPLVIIDCYGHWSASSLGLFGVDDIECDDGGTLFCLNFWGGVGLRPGYDSDGGFMSGYCFFTSGAC